MFWKNLKFVESECPEGVCFQAKYCNNVLILVGGLIKNLQSHFFNVSVIGSRDSLSWAESTAPKDELELSQWIVEAEKSYLENAGDNAIIERMPEEIWLDGSFEGKADFTKDELIPIYLDSGIIPMLLLKEVYFFEKNQTVIFQFKTDIDEFLSDHGFCLRYKNGSIDFITDDVLFSIIYEWEKGGGSVLSE